MALIVFHSGKCLTLPADKATEAFLVWNGDKKGTDEQIRFTNQIARIYLSKAAAPVSYRQKYSARNPASKELWFKSEKAGMN